MYGGALLIITFIIAGSKLDSNKEYSTAQLSLLIASLLVCCAFAGCTLWRSRTRRLFLTTNRLRLQSLLRCRRLPNGQFNFVIRSRLSVAITEHLDQTQLESYPPVVQNRATATELLNPLDSLSDIRDRVMERPRIVLGISGSRGVGKTTTLNYLKRFENEIGSLIRVTLPMPSTRTDIARYALDATANELAGNTRPDQYRRYSRTALWLFAVFLLLSLTVTLIDWSGSQLNTDHPSISASIGNILPNLQDIDTTTVVACALILIFALFVVWIGYFVASSLQGREYASAVARDVQERLQFEKETTHQNSAGLDRNIVLGFQRFQRKRERAILPGDTYTLFERLVREFNTATGKQVVLLIDELDRYEFDSSSKDGRSLEEALNALKPFFLIPNVSAVISVSSQALAAFTNRRESVLGVLDSTFDEMVEMPLWSDEELATLLSSLAVGLSKNSVERLAHLSCGRPREAMRLTWLFCRLMSGHVPTELKKLLAGRKFRLERRLLEKRSDEPESQCRLRRCLKYIAHRLRTCLARKQATKLTQSVALDVLEAFRKGDLKEYQREQRKISTRRT